MLNWIDKHIEIEPTSHPKKVTGTRFGAILGKNAWVSPFQAWCDITKVYNKPFEDTIYTIAGKTIEPKQIAYMKNVFLMDNLKTPTDIYGSDYFTTTHGDFFPDTPMFGGMWDSILVDENNNPIEVLEFKTTKRAEDWLQDIPEYYALQASLYAYLLGVDKVTMVCSLLSESDYENPEDFTPSANNTFTRSFLVSEKFPSFDVLYGQAVTWWNEHVTGGVSPDYDEEVDAEYLKELRTNYLNPDTDIEALLAEADTLQTELDANAAEVKDKEDRLSAIKNMLKQYAIEQFRDGDKSAVFDSDNHKWTVSKKTLTTVDTNKLKLNGLYDNYSVTKEIYTLNVKEIN